MMRPVQFDDDLVRHTRERRRRAHSRSQRDLAIGSHFSGFNYRPVDRPQETIAHRLRKRRQVQIEEMRLPVVDGLAQNRIALIGSPKPDRVRARQSAVQIVVG